MKYSVAILVAALAPAAFSADYITGQAARMIIGQKTFTAEEAGPSNLTLGGVGGVSYAADTLFVADSNRVAASPLNRRVLIYKGISSKFPSPTASLNDLVPRCNVCTADQNAPRSADVVLGQPDFGATDMNLSQSGMRLPTAIASDGNITAVADTENNRVLIWHGIPSQNGQNADIVLGQADFTHGGVPGAPSASSMRGPQGVWIQNGKLYVADTQNHRVLVWNSIPTSNGAAADIVLGQPSFTVAPEPDLTKADQSATSSNLLNPVSVYSDGTRLLVADLGHNRVVIWNDINSLSTNKPVDVVIGQPDATSSVANNSSKLCASNGKDSSGNATYPARCATTLNFPRFALSDGQRLYIADGGNDRVLVYNTIPGSGFGAAADLVLGQKDMISDPVNDTNNDTFNPNLSRLSADTIRTPTSLAWDGTNLYVAEPYARRILVFTPAAANISTNGVRNAASREIYAVGLVTFSGTVTAGDTVTLTIAPDSTTTGKDYKYTIVKNDTFSQVVSGLVTQINANGGDANVLATADLPLNAIQLTARKGGDTGNSVKVSDTLSSNATLTVTITNPSGGKDAAKIGPGTLVSIIGTQLCDCAPTSAPDGNALPRDLAGAQVYFDGVKAPLMYVSPTQINAQVPYRVADSNAINAYVRFVKQNGDVVITNAVGVPIAIANPGIFAFNGSDPRQAVAFHNSSNAIALVSVDGAVNSGDTGTIKIGSNSYTYTVKATDTLLSIRDAFVGLINANASEQVTAAGSGSFTRIVLTAKTAGSAGNGIAISVSTSTSAKLVLTALDSATCCASTAGTLVTADKPAAPGETIYIFATGLGPIHQPGFVNVLITVGGTINAGDTATVSIGSNNYTYTVKSSDTVTSIRDGLISLINAGTSESLSASASGTDQIVLSPKITGSSPSGSGAAVGLATSSGAKVTLSGISSQDPAAAKAIAGEKYAGPMPNEPDSSVSSLVGGKTANIISAGLEPGMVGVYRVVMEISSGLTTNPLTQMTIAQDIYVSNIVTIPVVKP